MEEDDELRGGSLLQLLLVLLRIFYELVGASECEWAVPIGYHRLLTLQLPASVTDVDTEVTNVGTSRLLVYMYGFLLPNLDFSCTRLLFDVSVEIDTTVGR